MRYVVVGLLVVLLGACSDTATTVTEVSNAPEAATLPEPTSDLGSATAPPATAVSSTPIPATTIPTTEATDDQAANETPVNDGLFPTVVEVSATTGDGVTWRFDVTLLSEYDSPARYADAWRVLDAQDNELGIRVLAHDHAGEQPFTRSTSVEVPDGTTTVFVEGRDQLNGWSGERFEVTLTP